MSFLDRDPGGLKAKAKNIRKKVGPDPELTAIAGKDGIKTKKRKCGTVVKRSGGAFDDIKINWDK